jgi:hypothetical protein
MIAASAADGAADPPRVDANLGIEAHIHIPAGIGLPHRPNASLRGSGF